MTGRRLAAIAVSAALLAAACGDSSDGAPVLAPDDTGDTASTADAFTADAFTADETTGETAETTGRATAEESTAPLEDQVGEVKPTVVPPAETPTELQITDLVVGEGEPAEAGDLVSLNYVGVLSDSGDEFDSSWERGQTFDVTLGSGGVIEGFDEGLMGVREGGRRQIDIPSELAYGEAGAGEDIPPNSAITFVVDIMSIEFAPELAPRADDSECPAADGSSEPQREFDEYPPTCIDPTSTYTAEIVTNFGDITVELDPERAPFAVNSFVVLARYHYFDDTVCHRAIPDFVVQCGDPTATGSGGPGYQFPDELPEAGEYEIGSLAMANAGPGTNGSQFFIITGDNGVALPPQYSLFGSVTEGLDTTVADLNEVANPESNGVPPLEEIRIESVTITES